MQVDRSQQILQIDVPRDTSFESEEVRLFPGLKGLLGPDSMVPAAALAAKAKSFDDGLMAAVERAADQGAGTLTGKNELLAAWLKSCPSPHLSAALSLRGVATSTSPEVERDAARLIAQFLSDRARSHPTSFYSWDRDLEGIFRRDRFLQTPLGQLEAERLWGGLPDRPAYGALLRLIERLGNPLVSDPAALHLEGETKAVFPPVRAPETELALRLLGTGPIPPGFDLIEELIRHLEQGKLSLQPGPTDGWYAYQLWCLEPLVQPGQALESARLRRGKGYQDCLREMFRAQLTMVRETHVKQIQGRALGCAMMQDPLEEIRPSLTLEPMVTYYQRRAESYEFAGQVLREIFGAEALLHRMTPTGPISVPLFEELETMQQLFRGCAAQAAFELGLAWPDTERSLAVEWLRTAARDPEVGLDVRAMVPLFYDVERRRHKVLALLGYAARPLTVSFFKPPGLPPGARADFKADREQLIYPVAIEVYCDRLMDRQEFRSFCDQHSSSLAGLRHALSLV